MKKGFCVSTVLLFCAIVSIAIAKEKIDLSKLPPPSTKKPDFEGDIWPILKERCIHCHGAEKQKGKYRVDSREAALKGQEGPNIVPGKSAESRFVHLLVPEIAGEDRMPPPDDKGKVPPLTAQQIGIIRAWIDQGAPWPEQKKEPVVLVDFAKEIQPIFKASCEECHGATQQKGGFRVDTKDDLLKGGKSYGKVILPGNPAKSSLVMIFSGQDEDIAEKEKHKLPPQQVELIKKWIGQGAK
jgi:mono/diheme cytochrome c family protein